MLEKAWQGEWRLTDDKTGIILLDWQGRAYGSLPIAQGAPPAPKIVEMTLGPGPGKWLVEGSETLCWSGDGTRRLWVGPLPVSQVEAAPRSAGRVHKEQRDNIEER